ncbi:DUF4376 domain-containing protein [Sphingomonas sp. R1]|uniref:DUF4376 domain-containing protein n=1 Tax=Sphingomonas sp. R1 TaxID=399176 RepID=UPI002224AE81|nr:DUF4376 domain-containing protein [Sphingomonas sp. R1]UYY77802.1 DUF4376 domain-containing protein [Sphingomonas sp. R1]
MGVVIMWPSRQEAHHRADGMTEGYDLSGATVVEVPAGFSWAGHCIDWDLLTVSADLDAARARRWEDVKAMRNAAASGGCETPLGRVDTTDASRVLITGAVQMAQLSGGAYAVDWTMADNSKVTHDGPAMIAMGVAVAQHIAACWAHGQALREAIGAASTAEALDSIDINAGWPGQ